MESAQQKRILKNITQRIGGRELRRRAEPSKGNWELLLNVKSCSEGISKGRLLEV